MESRLLDVDSIRSVVELPPESTGPDRPCPFPASCADLWMWNPLQSADPAKLVLVDDVTVVFHPRWSSSTVGVRGTRLLNGGMYYWEIAFGSRVYGSAMMVGISTPTGRLESAEFNAIIGEDENSWGLSHTGHLYHGGQTRKYCQPFEEHKPTVIGILFDGRVGGRLTFFKDGKSLGLAFADIRQDQQELYPMISSTAAKTSMRVQNMRKNRPDLRDRCRDAVLRRTAKSGSLDELSRLPLSLRRYVMLQSWKVRRLCPPA